MNHPVKLEFRYPICIIYIGLIGLRRVAVLNAPNMFI